MSFKEGKILVIDDLSDWREIIGSLLTNVGYEFETAADMDEAMRLLRHQPYSVAVVDLRLDEMNEQNQDGLLLAEQMKDYLPELAIIMLTSHANIASVKQAPQSQEEGPSIAFNFLKKDDISELPQIIAHALGNVP